MPRHKSIYPSESPQWGWLVPVLNCTDLNTTLDFYLKLGFRVIGGDVANKWAIIQSSVYELHLFEGHVSCDMLNFRGGNPRTVKKRLKELGWTAKLTFGPNSYVFEDPNGRHVFFDMGDPEITQFKSGQRFTVPIPEEQPESSQPLDLGNFSWCLHCEDLQETYRYYRSFGFIDAGLSLSDWINITRPDHKPKDSPRWSTMQLSLFSGLIQTDMLSFRGADITVVRETLVKRGIRALGKIVTESDGSETLLLRDPDGRPIWFDTPIYERLYE